MKSLLLVFATFIWGLGFVGTRWTFMEYSAIWSNTLRFVFAGLIALPFLIKDFRSIFQLKLVFCSLLLAAGLQLQTIGIELTTLAKSGFLTVCYALFTPVIGSLFFGTKLRWQYWALLALAMVGVAFLCELNWDGFNQGDMFILSSALLFSCHIWAVDKWSEGFEAIKFNLIQCLWIGLLCLLGSILFTEVPSLEPLISSRALVWPSALYGFLILSIFSSLIAFSLQVSAQQTIKPHVVSMIFLLESIFAATFGYIFFEEQLSKTSIFGCGLVLFSVGLIPFTLKINKE